MRNKTEQFKKKYNVHFDPNNNPQPLKTNEKTFYRSTCNLNTLHTETNLTLRSERQLL